MEKFERFEHFFMDVNMAIWCLTKTLLFSDVPGKLLSPVDGHLNKEEWIINGCWGMFLCYYISDRYSIFLNNSFEKPQC